MGAAVVVVVGCGGVVVVVVGLGSGGQGHVARSGWVGPLVQPSQLGHVTRDITGHVTEHMTRVTTHCSWWPHSRRR